MRKNTQMISQFFIFLFFFSIELSLYLFSVWLDHHIFRWTHWIRYIHISSVCTKYCEFEIKMKINFSSKMIKSNTICTISNVIMRIRLTNSNGIRSFSSSSCSILRFVFYLFRFYFFLAFSFRSLNCLAVFTFWILLTKIIYSRVTNFVFFFCHFFVHVSKLLFLFGFFFFILSFIRFVITQSFAFRNAYKKCGNGKRTMKSVKILPFITSWKHFTLKCSK